MAEETDCTLTHQTMEEFIRALPKAELHLHLEGTIAPETVVELSELGGGAAMTLAEAEALYAYTDFGGFLMAFKAVVGQLRGPAEYELAAWRMLEKLAAQGVKHAEVYISVGVIFRMKADEDKADPELFQKIFAGLERARVRGERELGVTLSWIFDAVRHFTVPEAERVFRLAARMRAEYPSIVGIGLGGDERLTGSEPFAEIYAEAREAGLRLTNHAGETTGPEAIWEALAIGSERIGHAVSAFLDEGLMAELLERQVPLELNPTSNVRTGVVGSFGEHPLRRYFDQGLLVTLNSDDPAFFGSTLEEEYGKAHREHGFSREELKRLAANSFRASFLPETERERWVRAVEGMA